MFKRFLIGLLFWLPAMLWAQNIWEPVQAGLPSTFVTQLTEVHAGLYLAQAGQMVYRSTNQGDTWDVLPECEGGTCRFTDKGRLFRRVQDRGFRSDDGGRSWIPTQEPLPTDYPIQSFVTLPTQTMIGLNPHAAYASADDGNTWHLIGLASDLYNALFITPSGYLYASMTMCCGSSGTQNLIRYSKGWQDWHTLQRLSTIEKWQYAQTGALYARSGSNLLQIEEGEVPALTVTNLGSFALFSDFATDQDGKLWVLASANVMTYSSTTGTWGTYATTPSASYTKIWKTSDGSLWIGSSEETCAVTVAIACKTGLLKWNPSAKTWQEISFHSDFSPDYMVLNPAGTNLLASKKLVSDAAWMFILSTGANRWTAAKTVTNSRISSAHLTWSPTGQLWGIFDQSSLYTSGDLGQSWLRANVFSLPIVRLERTPKNNFWAETDGTSLWYYTTTWTLFQASSSPIPTGHLWMAGDFLISEGFLNGKYALYYSTPATGAVWTEIPLEPITTDDVTLHKAPNARQSSLYWGSDGMFYGLLSTKRPDDHVYDWARFDPATQQWSILGTNILNNRVLNARLTAVQGRFVAATDAGVWISPQDHTGAWTPLSTDLSLPVRQVFAQPNGLLWAATSRGLYRYSNTLTSPTQTEAEAPHALNQASAFPNPAHTSFNVQVPANMTGKVQFHVYNLLGQTVHQQTFSAADDALWQSIETRTWASGLYTYRFTAPNVAVQGKIIIRH